MKFDEIFIDDTKNVTRIDKSKVDFNGSIAVVDQGKELISGYTNKSHKNVCYEERIIFGDHTRNFKYIDFPFVCGADGTKVLKIIEPNKTNIKYMYYYLLSSKIPDTGYNRHFKWVKELSFNIPDYKQQLTIAKKMDNINELISIKKKQILKHNELINSKLHEMIDKCKTKVRLDTLIEPYKAEKCGSNNYPVLSITMHNGLVLQSSRFKKEIASKDKSNYKIIPNNKLVVAFPIDEGLLCAQTIVDVGIVSPAYSVYSIKESLIHPIVLESILRSEQSIKYYKSKLKGTTLRRRTIPKSDFDSMEISLPQMVEQVKFVDIRSRILNQKALLEKQLERLEELQASLMQEYFN